MHRISNYFSRTKKYSVIRFIVEMSVLAFLLKMLAIIIAVPVLISMGLNTETNLELEKGFLEDPFLVAGILIILFAAFETIIGQMFILWLSKKISKAHSFRILCSAIVFALLHVEPIIMAAVFPIGLILAWAFVLYREKSLWSAIWVTTAIHVAHNLFALWLVSVG